MNEDFYSDRVIRDKLEGFSVDPPDYIWKNIQSQLATAKRKRRIIWMTWISSAAVIVLALAGGWFYATNTNEIVTQSENTQTGKQIERTESVTNSSDHVFSTDINKGLGIKSTVKRVNYKNTDRVLTGEKHDIGNETAIIDESNHSRNNQLITESLVKRNVRIYQAEKDKKSELLMNKPADISMSKAEMEQIAQNLKNAETKKSKNEGVKMGLYLSPGYSSHTASYSVNYRNNMNNNISDGNANIGGGFSVIYKLKKRWGLESGVYYAQNGQKSRKNNSVFSIQKDYSYINNEMQLVSATNKVNLVSNTMVLNNSAGKVILNELPPGTEFQAELDNKFAAAVNNVSMTGEFSQVFDFVEVPLYARFDLIDADFDVQLIGGINAGIVTGNKAFVANGYGIQQVGKTEDISNLNLSGTLGVGLSYDLGKSLSISVEPRINYFINSLNKSGEINYRPYRIGIYSGINYEF